MHRIFHLDLKGAPPKVNYIEKVLDCAKQWGATGVLLEWEDTFPYFGELSDIGSIGGCGGDGVYTLEEIHKIFTLIKERDLEPIQLVQTIGHMEFVLKHPAFRELREAPRSPAVLCPSKPQSQVLVCNMVQQALSVQPDAKYFHIGADEVWHTAVCNECQRRSASNKHKVHSLFLDHIQKLALFLKKERPNLTLLMWDDMLRNINWEILEEYKLGELIEPVVWNYNIKECFHIDKRMWEAYSKVFPKVWAGSAFKGANGSCQVLSPVARYVSNQEGWLKEIKQNSKNMNFVGVFLTGWSRYDHYATLCELLPVSLPCLSSCLKVWNDRTESLNEVIREVLPDEEWPGVQLARCVHSFVMLRERAHNLLYGDLISSWLNPWQVERGYTSPVQVEGIAVTSHALLTDLKALYEELVKQLNAVTGERSRDEWLKSYFTPTLVKMTELHETAMMRANTEAGVRP